MCSRKELGLMCLKVFVSGDIEKYDNSIYLNGYSYLEVMDDPSLNVGRNDISINAWILPPSRIMTSNCSS